MTIIVVSAIDGRGIDELRAHIRPGATVAFVGSSGVGKSTLVNTIAGDEVAAVREIRADDARGRHTTSRRQLHLMPDGGLVLDTPGMRELGLWDADAGLERSFADIDALAATCRFSDCGHAGEPGCAVAAAIVDGDLDASRFEGWKKLEREARHLERRVDHLAREAERRRWRTISKSVEQAHGSQVREGRLVMATNTTAGIEVQLPDAPPVAGLRFRSFDMDRDVAPLADLIVEADLADQDNYLPSVDDLRNELEHQAGFDPARDMLLAEVDGKLVGGTLRTTRVRAGVVQHELDGWVRPEHRRQGIGRALLHWTEARAREAAGEWTGSEPHSITRWVSDTQIGAVALLEAEGYGRVRYGFMMVRDLAEPIPDAPLPDGLDVRPVVEADHRRIWDADTEAFRDHWDAGVANRGGLRRLVLDARHRHVDVARRLGRRRGGRVGDELRLRRGEREARRATSAGSSTSPSAGRGAAAALPPRSSPIRSGSCVPAVSTRPRSASTRRTCRARSGSTSPLASADTASGSRSASRCEAVIPVTDRDHRVRAPDGRGAARFRS